MNTVWTGWRSRKHNARLQYFPYNFRANLNTKIEDMAKAYFLPAILSNIALTSIPPPATAPPRPRLTPRPRTAEPRTAPPRPRVAPAAAVSAGASPPSSEAAAGAGAAAEEEGA